MSTIRSQGNGLEHLDGPNDDEAVDVPSNGIDLPRIEKAVREILIAIGENPDREGLVPYAEPRGAFLCRADGGAPH